MNKKETIRWILDQFKSMGASWIELQLEKVRMLININHLRHNMWLLDL